MMPFFKASAILALTFLSASVGVGQDVTKPLVCESPGGNLRVTLQLDETGRPTFEVASGETSIVKGGLGLTFAETGSLDRGLQIVDVQQAARDETYAIPIGKASQARDRHSEMIVSLRETEAPHRKLDIAFRAFDDGVAFRYLIPTQQPLAKFVLTEEQTRLSFSGDLTARLLPLRSYTTSYEAYYSTQSLSKIDSSMLIGLPLLLERPNVDAKSLWIAVTEANLTDYAGMYLCGVEGEPDALVSMLSPLPDRTDGAKVLGEAPFESPWRVLMVADDPGRLIESHLVFHLSDPPAIKDTSWIKPGKTTFPWWNGYVLEGVDFSPGVNTATMKHYIDFCAEHGIPYHSLDGLDIAWYGGGIQPRGKTDITTAAPSIDMPELLRYAKQKGVRLRLWMHWKALKPQIDEAFALYEKWGIEGVMVDFMDRDDQEMVRWYHEVARKAAKHHLTVTWHGAYKPTGMERTWPNVLTYEAVLNQEYNKWQPQGVRGTPPEHNLDVAFIRMLAGPLDFHQGGMRNVLPEHYKSSVKAPPVQGTRGHQLAMYLVYQNHLPMLADYPAAYRDQMELKFLIEIPVNWDETHVLHAKMGESLVVARRKGDDWYLGGMTADNTTEAALPLGFLGSGRFLVELYLDDPDKGSTAVTYRQQNVSATDTLGIAMPRAGGFAARITRIAK